MARRAALRSERALGDSPRPHSSAGAVLVDGSDRDLHRLRIFLIRHGTTPEPESAVPGSRDRPRFVHGGRDPNTPEVVGGCCWKVPDACAADVSCDVTSRATPS